MQRAFLLASLLALTGPAIWGANITALSYNTGGCVTTVADGCAGIGVTAAGSTGNPFLNDISTKAIDIGFGDYLTFNEPFWGSGAPLTITLGFSDSTSVFGTFVFPSTPGTTIGSLSGGGGTITFTTSGLDADRMSFGFAPGTFNPSGTSDTVIAMSFAAPSTGAPEPATLGMLGTAATLLMVLKRRWINKMNL